MVYVAKPRQKAFAEELAGGIGRKKPGPQKGKSKPDHSIRTFTKPARGRLSDFYLDPDLPAARIPEFTELPIDFSSNQLLADHWAIKAAFSTDFIENHENIVQRAQNRVNIHLKNGQASYNLGEYHADDEFWEGFLRFPGVIWNA